jgi:hypothetical protein
MLKQFVARFIQWAAKIQAEVNQKSSADLLMEELRADARRSTVEFIKTEIPEAVWFENKFEMMNYALQRLADGLVLEFGVWTGRTINFIASRTDRTVHGFDSFEGLPELWKGFKYVDFSTRKRLPVVKENVRLHVGWFDDTLPRFLDEYREPIAFVHIDCDIYRSSKTVLDLIGHRVLDGTYIEFDDYFCFPGWADHSHKAFREFLDGLNIGAEYVGFTGDQVLVKLLRR